MTTALCLLVWNERPGCEHDVSRLPLHLFDQVFAIDGGSTDGTIEYLRSQGIPVIPQSERGYNAAYLSAFRHCRCTSLVIFPPKGNIDPGSVAEVRSQLLSGIDLVIASRIMKGAVNEEDARLLKPRKWFVESLGLIANVLWRREGRPIADVLHGFRGMRCEAFWQIDPLPHGLSIDLEMVVGSYRRRLSRIEVPVTERTRLVGTTHFKALPTGWKLLKYLRFELTRRKVTRGGERALKAHL